MLKTDDFERMLVESIVSGAQLEISVDALVAHLLSAVPGYSARSTDGVIFEYSRISGMRAMASGVVIMIDQTVEPLRLEVTLGEDGSHLSAARVCFGDSTSKVGYGSREYRKLRDAILADPAAGFAWKEVFQRDANGWRHGAG